MVPFLRADFNRWAFSCKHEHVPSSSFNLPSAGSSFFKIRVLPCLAPYADVAIYGDNFRTAGKATSNLFRRRGFSGIISDTLGATALTCASIAIATLIGICAYLLTFVFPTGVSSVMVDQSRISFPNINIPQQLFSFYMTQELRTVLVFSSALAAYMMVGGALLSFIRRYFLKNAIIILRCIPSLFFHFYYFVPLSTT